MPLSRAGVIFELGNALAACDLERALKLVRRLLDQGETAIGILLVAILPTIRNLLLAKDLMERHRLPRPHAPFSFISALNRLPAEATAHLPRKKDGSINGYALGIAAQQAHRFETAQLIAGLEACLEANLQLVSSQLDHELILTEIVVKLLGRHSLKQKPSALVARSPRQSAYARSGRCREYPSALRERFHDRDYEDDQKSEVHEERRQRPKACEKTADARDGTKR